MKRAVGRKGATNLALPIKKKGNPALSGRCAILGERGKKGRPQSHGKKNARVPDPFVQYKTAEI